MGDQLEGNHEHREAVHLCASQGYLFIDGPSDSSRDAPDAAGFKGVAFNATTADLILYDDLASDLHVRPGDVIGPAARFGKKLNRMIARLEATEDIPQMEQIIRLLRLTHLSLTTTGVVRPPPNVRIVATSVGGISRGTANALRIWGLNLIDPNTAPALPRHMALSPSATIANWQSEAYAG